MKDFTKGGIGQQIISFALPIIGANLMMQSYQLIDSIIVGKCIGKQALAAVGASAPVLFCVISLMIGVGSGAAVVISQYFGAKKKQQVQLTSETIHLIFISFGIIAGILGILFSGQIFRLIGIPSEMMTDASSYLSIYLGGIILGFGLYTLCSMLRGVGDSITPLYLFSGSAVLNIILDIILICVLGFGIKAAAAATIISQGVMYIAGILYINSHDKGFVIRLRNFHFDREIFRQCLHYGIPTGLQQFLVALGSIALMSIVSEFGTDVVAGYAAGLRIDNIAILPAMNFAAAITPFVGQNIGANNFQRIRTGIRYTLLYSSLFALFSTIVVQLAGTTLIQLFTSDTDVITHGEKYLRTVSLFYLLFNAMFVTCGLLKGAGAMTVTTLITVISLWIVRIPLAKYFSDAIGSDGIWWAIPAGWLIGCVCTFIYYISGNWKTMSVVSHETLDPDLELEQFS